MIFRGWQKVSLMDYPGKIVTTVFTGGCNFKCPYCHNWELVENGRELEIIEEKEVLAFLEKRKTLIDGICISGGEPTIHGDLPAFVSKVKSIGKIVKLDTNGTNPGMLEILLNEGMLDYVAMDIKCSLDNYKNLTRCGEEELAKVAETIGILKNSGIDYEFRTTLTEQYNPPEDAAALADLVSGARRYALQKFCEPAGQMMEQLSPLGDLDAQNTMETVRPYVGEILMRGYR